jgi:hypothetical protein
MIKYILCPIFALFILVPINAAVKDDEIINNLDFFQTMQLIKDDSYTTVTLIESMDTSSNSQSVEKNESNEYSNEYRGEKKQ